MKESRVMIPIPASNPRVTYAASQGPCLFISSMMLNQLVSVNQQHQAHEDLFQMKESRGMTSIPTSNPSTPSLASQGPHLFISSKMFELVSVNQQHQVDQDLFQVKESRVRFPSRLQIP